MAWIADNKDLVSLVIALLAVALSFSTIYIQRRQLRLEAYRHVDQVLASPEAQKGRRLAFEVSRTGQVPELDSDAWHLISRAITLFDMLGVYSRRGIVDERLVLDVWHHQLRDIRPAAEAMARFRMREFHAWAPWAGLWPLVRKAERYRSSLACCDDGKRRELARDLSVDLVA